MAADPAARSLVPSRVQRRSVPKSVGQPSGSLGEESSNVERRSRKPHFGEPPDSAKAIRVGEGAIRQQQHLHVDRTWICVWYIRGKQAIVRTSGRAPHLLHSTLPPAVTANQSYGRYISSLNLLEIALWKLDENEQVFAVGEIENRLPFDDRRTRTSRRRPYDVAGRQIQLVIFQPRGSAPFRDNLFTQLRSA